MHPIVTVVEIGGRHVPLTSYGVCVTLALAIAAAGVLRAAIETESDLGGGIALFGLALGAGLWGAVVLHVAVQSVRLGSLGAGLAHPGLASFGAGLGAAIAVAFAAPRLHVSALPVLDRAVPTLCLAQAVGRMGCLLGGCCYGHQTSGRLAFVALGGRHPVPLYEALALLVLALVFSRMRASGGPYGARTWQAIAAYCVLRIGLECLRADEVRGVMPVGILLGQVSVAQLVAMAVLIVSARYWRKGARMELRSVPTLRG